MDGLDPVNGRSVEAETSKLLLHSLTIWTAFKVDVDNIVEKMVAFFAGAFPALLLPQ